MKKHLVWGGALILILGVLGTGFFSAFEIVPAHVPPPASEISLEIADAAMGSAITEEVGTMLFQNPHYYPLRALQGTASNTEYYFRLNGTCAQAAELIADLTEVIRRHTDAPVRCTDPA